jgi:hypothetical protein
MATYSCTVNLALDIARRLALGNIPFNLDASRHPATITCKFGETLACVVDQAKRGVTGSMEYPQLQQIPRKPSCDCGEWHSQGKCSLCKNPSRDVEYIPDVHDLNELDGEGRT